MRDITHKQISLRTARAAGIIFCSPATIELIRTDQKTLASVVAGQIVERTPNGRVHSIPLLMNGLVGQHFNSPSDADLRQRVDTVAEKYGLSVASVEVLHPLDSALAVTYTVSRGKPSWTFQELESALLGSPTDIEGIYLQLNSPGGRDRKSVV